MLRIAYEDNKIQRVPKIHFLKEPPARKGFLELKKFEELVGLLPTHLRPLVPFLYYDGVRLGEALSIEWPQVDLQGRVIRLEEGQTKSDEPLVVPLPSPLVAMLREIEPKRGRVFDETNLRVEWERACAACGLGKRTLVERKDENSYPYHRYNGLLLHDLRRSAVRNLVQAGVPETRGELASSTLAAKLLWSKIEYVGIAGVAPALLVTVCRTTGRGPRLRGRGVALLAVPSLLVLAAAWTNGAHHLLWRRMAVEPAPPHNLVITHGPAFAAYVSWSYLLVVVALGLVAHTAVTAPTRMRGALAMLAVVAAAPIAGNVVYVLGRGPGGDIDLTPFAFGISAAAVAYGLFRFRALDVFLGLVPVARERVIVDMTDAVVVLDDRGRVVERNAAARRLLGDDEAGLAATLSRWPSDLVAVRGEAGRAEVVRNGDRPGVVLDVSASALRDRAGRVVGRLVVARDVTERRVAEYALRESEARFRELFEGANDVVFSLDTDGRFVAINPAGERVLGRTADDIVGSPVERVLAEPEGNPVERLFTCEERDFEVSVLRPDGRVVPLEVRTRIAQREGVVVGVQGIARDVTERKRFESELTRQAIHDPLTGLANRALFRDRVAHALARARPGRHRLAVLLLDLDDFKTINDSLGHDVGDELLREVAPASPRSLRPATPCARLGGDEFAVLLERRPTAPRRRPRSPRASLTALAEPVVVDRPRAGRARRASASSLADAAAHAAARSCATPTSRCTTPSAPAASRGCEVFEAGMLDGRAARLRARRRALAGARARAFRHPLPADRRPRRGPDRRPSRRSCAGSTRNAACSPPGEFIPIAEETGLIVPLGELASCAARDAAGAALVRRRSARRPAVSVNVSGRELQERALSRPRRRGLADTGLDPDALVLEITETVLPARRRDGAGAWSGCAAAACGSRSTTSAPATRRSATCGGSRSTSSRSTARSSRAAAAPPTSTSCTRSSRSRDSLDLETVAEGIETDDQRERLARMRCPPARASGSAGRGRRPTSSASCARPWRRRRRRAGPPGSDPAQAVCGRSRIARRSVATLPARSSARIVIA